MKPYLEKLLTRSRESFKELKKTDIQKRNDALLAIVEALEEKTAIILDANIKDVINARATGMNSSLLDRLSLSENRIMDMAQNVRKIIELPDPIGNILETTQLEYGTKIEKISEPLGVIAMIYEARPSFTVDAAALAIKSGNSCVLRGGKETLKTNMMLSEIIREAIADHIPADSVLFIEDTVYSIVEMLLTAQKKVDLIIPRGSTRLMDLVHAEARVPVLLAGPGICTAYIGETADLKKAMAVVISGKTQRPSVCNALENLLVHEKIAAKFIPMLYDKLKQKKTELRGDETIVQLTGCTPATPEDFDTEYLDYILSAKTVQSTKEAIDFINEHGSHHSDVIVSQDDEDLQAFLNDVDSAVIYVNTSTRFDDGAEFGAGTELGISTQKLHVRGPIALTDLITTKHHIMPDAIPNR